MKFSPRTAVACLVVLLALAGVFCLAATGILQPWRTFRSSIYPISLHLPQGYAAQEIPAPAPRSIP